jgi:hypothetical protein
MRQASARFILHNQAEASVLHGILEQDGVPHYIRSFNDRAYDALWQFQEGWGYVETDARFASGVRVLLDVLRKNRLQLGEEEQEPEEEEDSGPADLHDPPKH